MVTSFPPCIKWSTRPEPDGQFLGTVLQSQQTAPTLRRGVVSASPFLGKVRSCVNSYLSARNSMRFLCFCGLPCYLSQRTFHERRNCQSPWQSYSIERQSIFLPPC